MSASCRSVVLLPPCLLLGVALGLAGCEVGWEGRTVDDLGPTSNTAPVLVLSSPVVGGMYGTATAIPFSGTVTDDGDTADLYLTITSNLDGLIDRPTIGDDGTFATSGLLTQGAHEITVTATDVDGLQASLSLPIQVDDGGVGSPVLTVVLDPDPPVGRSSTACLITAEDPDGLPVTVSSLWRVNGEDRGTTEVGIDGLQRDDELSCEVTATSAGGTSTDSATALVANSPPDVEEVLVTGAPATEDGELQCSGTGSDYDGDGITFLVEWVVNGTGVLTGSETVDGDAFDRDDSVVCRLSAQDGSDVGDPVDSDPVIIQNSGPGAPSGVTVSPDSALIGAGLTCNVATTGSDADTSDPLVNEFRWALDGVEVPGATDSVYGTGAASEGQVITCSARTSDGDLASGWVDSDNSANVSEGLAGTQDTTDAWTTIAGTTDGDRLGRALADIGDLDGDGVSELALGANQHDSNRGEVFLFDGATVAAGGSLDDGDATVSWTGPDQGALFAGGEAVVGAGDVTGDGVPDLLTAAYRADGVGAAYLFASDDQGSWSSGAAEDQAALIFRGDADADDFALDVSAADVDGDGLSDVFIGAPFNDDNGESAGVVTVYLGAGLPGSGDVDVGDADHTFVGEQAGDLAGYAALESLGDVDGDGYGDFSVGARDGHNSASAKAGTLFVLSGADFATGGLASSGELQDVALLRIDGENADDQLGMAAAGLGDLDGDGAADFAVGARYADIQTVDAGGTYVFFGVAAGTLSAADASASFGAESSGDLAGKNLASGDVDGDGFADLMVSSHYDDSDGSNNGTAWLLLGGGWASWAPGDTLAGTAQASFIGNSNNDYLSGMSTLVDLDADGFDEMIIGADNDNAARGTVYVFTQP